MMTLGLLLGKLVDDEDTDIPAQVWGTCIFYDILNLALGVTIGTLL